MMPTDRFDRQLPVLLDELAQPRTPDYFDDLLGLTAGMRQRPAWTLLERWLPMVDIARQPAFVRQVPWRPIAVLTLILVLLAASLLFVIGSQQRVPAPFGPARNGLVAYATGGDIYTADPTTGATKVVVAGPETDLRPVFSLDGAWLAFERKAADGSGRLYVAKVNGTALTEVTREPLVGITAYAFSPDGREMVISAGPESEPSIHVAKSDGTGVRMVQTGLRAIEPAWRPPDGAEVLYTGFDASEYGGLYAFDADTGKVRTIVEPSTGRYRGAAKWSPDGAQIAYNEWVESNDMTVRTHIIAADGTGDRLLPTDPDARWEAFKAWSNDGKRLITTRGYTGLGDDVRVAVVPVDGSSPGVEIEYPGSVQLECCSSWESAPDDTTILGTPTDASGQALSQVMLDPKTGKSRTVPWSTNSYPAWQRLAP